MKKKSLIDTLKATKKANIVSTVAKNEGASTRKAKLSSQKMARYKMFQ